jgi:hypothetical protein
MRLDKRDWLQNGGQGAHNFIEAIKAEIPGKDRSYDKENDHTWTIKAKHADKIEELRVRFLVDERQGGLFE